MTDPGVQREINANLKRDKNREEAREDEGPVIDTAEGLLDPIIDTIGTSEEPDRDALERRRSENDETQRER